MLRLRAVCGPHWNMKGSCPGAYNTPNDVTALSTDLHHSEVEDGNVVEGLHGCCGDGKGVLREGGRGEEVARRTVVQQHGIQQLK